MTKKELSIFVDESGDFGPFDVHTPYYLVTMVFHDQAKSIEPQVLQLEQAMKEFNYTRHAIHTGPLIRKESEYYTWDVAERRAIFNKLFHFMRHCDITYHTFVFNKKEFGNPVEQAGRMAKEISAFLRDHADFFGEFERIVVYYDNGQTELNRILSTVFHVLYGNIEFRQVLPAKYRLFQVADLLCTLELVALKLKEHRLSKSERLFFENNEVLKKVYLRPAMKKKQ